MTLTVVTTPGDASTNAYCSLADAEAYVAATVWATDWTGKTDEQKKAALINSARLMDTINWVGSRSSQGQALAWPRCGAVIAGPRFEGLTVASLGYLLDRDGYQVATNTIPNRIRDANAEFALRLLAEDRAADAGGLAPETIKIGTLDLGVMRRRPIPASVMEMVREFVSGAGSPRMVLS